MEWIELLSSPDLELDDAGVHDDEAHDAAETRNGDATLYAARRQRCRLEAMEEEETWWIREHGLRASELTTARLGATSESFHGPLCNLGKTIEDFWYVKKNILI